MNSPTILIVEDEAIVSADIASKLRKLGYNIAGSTGTGEEAIEIARRKRPSLVLMDIRLAGAMDGIATADVIRREYQLPVVFLTAHADKATIQRAGKTEAFGYILKPFEDRELQTQIEMALYKHAADQRLRASESRFRLLSETAGQLLSADDPQDVINILCRQVMEHLDCQAFFNFMVDGDMGRLRLNSYGGIPEEEAQKIKFLEYGVAVCGCAAQEGCRIVAENIATTADPRTELVKSYGIQAYACHPLMAEGRVIGTLSFGTRTRSFFSPQDLSLMKTVADQVATAMERIRLMGELKKSHDELERRVLQRTADLRAANESLLREMEERSRVEAALRKSQERLFAGNATLTKVIDGITDPLIMLDAEFRVKKINRAAISYYGLTSYREAVGKLCFEAFRGQSRPCEGCERPFSELRGYSGTYERKGELDPDRIEQVFVYIVKDEFGAPEASIIRIYDITQAKKLERQLIQSEKLASLGLLISGIAHEINNPNTFISFNIPILRDYLRELTGIGDTYAGNHPGLELCGLPYPEFRQDIFKLLDNMEHGSNRINATVSALKKFSRTQDTVKKRLVALKALIDNALAICGAELRKRAKSLKVTIPEDLPLVFIDPDAIEQVLINLLINAAHALDKADSWIHIRVIPDCRHGQPERCIIEVADNGTGMEENVRNNIFDPFFTTKTSSVGTGLGLYICQNLIEKLGGSIDVDSRSGEGTVFRVILPSKPYCISQNTGDMDEFQNNGCGR